MLTTILSFGVGFCTGWVAKSLSIGEDPNTIWENSKKAATDAGEYVSEKAGEAKDATVEKVTDIKNKVTKKKAVQDVVNPDGTPAK
ncbi:MAG: hypothetical protein IKR19_08045 [Acholeplasmatales bacterium]|nr:hypothetical protein [Acholeplasmatales bacterium]